MEKLILNAWDEGNRKVKEWISTQDTSDIDYEYLLKNTLKIIFDDYEWYDCPSFDRITVIDHGDYQGTIVFIIADGSYQPSLYNYWCTEVSYGSCSGCDTLLSIGEYGHGYPNEDQIQQYWTLCLHMIQKMKKINVD